MGVTQGASRPSLIPHGSHVAAEALTSCPQCPQCRRLPSSALDSLRSGTEPCLCGYSWLKPVEKQKRLAGLQGFCLFYFIRNYIILHRTKAPLVGISDPYEQWLCMLASTGRPPAQTARGVADHASSQRSCPALRSPGCEGLPLGHCRTQPLASARGLVPGAFSGNTARCQRTMQTGSPLVARAGGSTGCARGPCFILSLRLYAAAGRDA